MCRKGNILSELNLNNGKDNIDNDQKINFPVTYTMKAIFNTELTREILQRNLELVLEEARVEYFDFRFRESSKGNYVTISAKVTLNDEKQFTDFYTKLKLLPGLKWAV